MFLSLFNHVRMKKYTKWTWTLVTFVGKFSQQKVAWQLTWGSTLANGRMNAIAVLKRFVGAVTCLGTNGLIPANGRTFVTFAPRRLSTRVNWTATRGFTPVRSPLNVTFALNVFRKAVAWRSTKWFTPAKSRTSAIYARRDLHRLHICGYTGGSTRARRRMPAWSAAKLFTAALTWPHTICPPLMSWWWPWRSKLRLKKMTLMNNFKLTKKLLDIFQRGYFMKGFMPKCNNLCILIIWRVSFMFSLSSTLKRLIFCVMNICRKVLFISIWLNLIIHLFTTKSFLSDLNLKSLGENLKKFFLLLLLYTT